MAFLFLLSLLLLPLINLKFAEAGCGCCCCCPSCCCKPIIIKLPPPPVKLCPCCCNCCCCNPCCCCGGGGGRKKRSVVDLMAKKFSDVLLPQLNQDALMPNIGGCGQTLPALAPLHSLCSQIPPSQRGPACQQITAQQFPLSQNIFNQQPGTLLANGGVSGGGDFDSCPCGNCASGHCSGCNGAQCANCAGAAAGIRQQEQQQQNCGGGSLCPNGAQMPGNVFHQNMGDLEGNAQPFNYAQNFAASSPCGNAASGRKKRALLLLRKLVNEPDNVVQTPERNASNNGRKEAKRETKTQNQSLVFRNNLEFVVRQSPQNI